MSGGDAASAAPPSLAGFYAARLDEDEAAARAVLADESDWPCEPDRVLREVAAGRAILALHRIEVEKVRMTPFDPLTGERRPDEWDVTCVICDWVSSDPSSACPTLRELAAVYSDHPDYRDEWKP